MRFSGVTYSGKIAAWLAALFLPPYYSRIFLSRLNHRGYISPAATVSHDSIILGKHVFIGDGVLIYQDEEGGAVELGDAVHLHRDTIMQTGKGGSIVVGAQTHIQPRCQFSAYMAPISIGKGVEIAPNCAFYPYNHGMAEGVPVRRQPLQSKGGIAIGDDAWLGVGVIVLDGVKIGRGAVVGAGSVVTRDLPDNSISSGVPARVVKMREDLGTDRSAGSDADKGNIDD